MNNLDLSGKLVKKCISLGASAAEVFLESNRNLSVNVLKSEIETIEEASSQGVGFRVFVDGKMGFSHCNDLSDKSLEDTIAKAIAFAKLSSPDENNVLTDDKGFTQVADLYDPGIVSEPMDKKIKMALELEKLAMKEPGITKSSGAGYGESESEIFIANSNGLLKSFKASACFAGVSVVAEKGDQKNTGGEYCSRVYFSDLPPLEEIAAKASKRALELLDPVMIKTQKAAVIIDPDVSRFLGGILSAVNGERVLQGASFLKDQMNKQFASPLLTITDDGTIPRSTGSSPFDGEGVPTMKNVIVDKGVLRSFIYNTRAARRAGVKSTGNASRSGFSSLPGIGTHKVYLAGGNQSRNEIIAATARGLLVLELTGYGIDPVTGNFSGGASGLWIEKGEILHPVKGVTIAGKAFDILNAIDMMGNDIDMNQGFAAPTFRIAEMQIGGK
ncbi:MAG TPA: TldD/PmbA family protein [Bacteroidales bacterium]|nr:TldD/PmbA family protein [Bacteroidales bacterium]HOX73332.1 TldD/PmbA family protein [Bacteroidales bacterium]HPM86570.1 TldD/PmbA family protein [Bacteroidales bacterium]HQM67846.1 TldD/PmbA family protein [Bacteroidales bacterium]